MVFDNRLIRDDTLGCSAVGNGLALVNGNVPVKCHIDLAARMGSGPDQFQVFVHKAEQLLHACLECILHAVTFQIQAISLDEDGGAEAITAPVDIAAAKDDFDTLRKDIYDFGQGVHSTVVGKLCVSAFSEITVLISLIMK